jgi:hypothetical protein
VTAEVEGFDSTPAELDSVATEIVDLVSRGADLVSTGLDLAWPSKGWRSARPSEGEREEKRG